MNENLFNPNENLKENLNENNVEINEATENLVDEPEGSEPANDVAFLGTSAYLEGQLTKAYENGWSSYARTIEHEIAKEQAKEYTDNLKK